MNHNAFLIGHSFFTATGTWRCTDVGTRTIAAIRIAGAGVPEDSSWFDGPPYAVAEIVFDENDQMGCSETALVG